MSIRFNTPEAHARVQFPRQVGQWAFDTCRQFYISSTVLSSSGRHRIVKLGACWGGCSSFQHYPKPEWSHQPKSLNNCVKTNSTKKRGWGEAGQNPSYHAPAVYRLCRDYMKKEAGRYGSSATEGRAETK